MRQTRKMVRRTQIICQLLPKKCLSVFDDFVRMVLKELILSCIMLKNGQILCMNEAQDMFVKAGFCCPSNSIKLLPTFLEKDLSKFYVNEEKRDDEKNVTQKRA